MGLVEQQQPWPGQHDSRQLGASQHALRAVAGLTLAGAREPNPLQGLVTTRGRHADQPRHHRQVLSQGELGIQRGCVAEQRDVAAHPKAGLVAHVRAEDYPRTIPCPALGGSRVARTRSSVLLPEPLAPLSPSTSPAASSRSTPRSTGTPPSRTSTASNRAIGSRPSRSKRVPSAMTDPSLPSQTTPGALPGLP